MGEQLPIISHESVWLIMVRVSKGYAEIVCNECDAVIRAIRLAEVENALRELARTDAISGARCPHCEVVNTFSGWKMIEAFICSGCRRGAAVDSKLQ